MDQMQIGLQTYLTTTDDPKKLSIVSGGGPGVGILIVDVNQDVIIWLKNTMK